MIGQPAPNFALVANDGKTYALKDLWGRNVVLVFYPINNTPGCNKQLSALRDDQEKFNRANAQVLGVNPAGVDAHQKFCDGFSFKFPILSDPELKVAKAYGAEKRGGNRRTVVVIGPEGKIVFHRYGMPTDDEILEALQ
ncbi:MAG: peroxiredoxin [Planctomycetes bacterium]|nr:peroxiredoxin [Planctomycetota bacterium]